jgi:hypothetical protein
MMKNKYDILISIIIIGLAFLLFCSYLDNRTVEGLLTLSIVLFTMGTVLLILRLITIYNYKSKSTYNYINKKVICINNIYYLEELDFTISKEYYIIDTYFSIKDNVRYCIIKDNQNNKIKIKESDLLLIFKL